MQAVRMAKVLKANGIWPSILSNLRALRSSQSKLAYHKASMTVTASQIIVMMVVSFRGLTLMSPEAATGAVRDAHQSVTVPPPLRLELRPLRRLDALRVAPGSKLLWRPADGTGRARATGQHAVLQSNAHQAFGKDGLWQQTLQIAPKQILLGAHFSA